MRSRLTICLALYRRLASAYPHEFRMLYGEDLDRLGKDAIPEVSRRYGLLGLVQLLTDIAVRLPVMYLAEIRQDVIYALRILVRSPGFASVAVLSLAIGIGMCCAFLSQIQSIMRPPPGVRDPAELVAGLGAVSYPYFERYRDQCQPVTAAAVFLGPVPFAVAFTGDKSAGAERIYGHLVSPEYFSTLGVTPASGRLFGPETEKPGMPPVVVVSDRFWRTKLGADPNAVGSSLRLNGSMATIVGIGPKGFLGIWPAMPADLFVPVTCGTALAPEMSGDPLRHQDREIFRLVLRLAPGATIPMAEASLDAITLNLDRENGIRVDQDRKGRAARLMPAGTTIIIRPEQRAAANALNVVLWALVLSLVCANLANLLLARGGQRRREIAVRLSMGASRPRLIRQFLTESVLLSVAGGLAGILLAYWITHAISSSLIPSWNVLEVNCEPDWRVLAWTLAIASAAGIGFGLAPALVSTRSDIARTLKEGAQAPMRGYGRFGSRNLFVVCQMAASLMLVMITWCIVLGFLRSTRVDPGFEVTDLNLFSLDPVRDGYSAREAAALLAGLPDELSRVNGVRSVSLTGGAPFTDLSASRTNTQVSTSDSEGRSGQVLGAVFSEEVGPNYFSTLGVALVGGREFDRRDTAWTKGSRTIPAVLNQTAAQALFGKEDPIGRQIREGERTYIVVGLTRDVQSGFLTPKPVATMFLPLTAGSLGEDPAQGVTVLVRCTASRDILAAVRRHLTTLHPDLTVFNVRTLQDELGRFNSIVGWFFKMQVILGAFALLLACIGLGGVTAYAVTQRRKEIGIRMALGARGHQVQWLVMKEGTALVAVGSAMGFCGAFALSRALAAHSELLARSFHYRVNDPLLIIGAPLLLAGLVMLACYLPARRATEIDPVDALREE